MSPKLFEALAGREVLELMFHDYSPEASFEEVLTSLNKYSPEGKLLVTVNDGFDMWDDNELIEFARKLQIHFLSFAMNMGDMK
jgi:hypothetical protein